MRTERSPNRATGPCEEGVKGKALELGSKAFTFPFPGGDKRDRTADLLNAIQALSQLSYTPMSGASHQNSDYNSKSRRNCQEVFSKISLLKKSSPLSVRFHGLAAERFRLQTGPHPPAERAEPPPLLQKARAAL